MAGCSLQVQYHLDASSQNRNRKERIQLLYRSGEKSDGTTKTDYAKKAIDIDPSNEQGYLLYLEALGMTMANFPVRTARILKAELQKMSGRKTYEEILEQNNDGYVNLAYQLGTAYYFAGGAENRPVTNHLASTWLSIVAQSVLDDTELGKLGLEAGTKLSHGQDSGV